MTSTPEQVLSFGIGNQTFGVNLLCVQEIRGWSPVTAVPQAPPHGLGVINFRGSIIPVFDSRVWLGVPAAGLTVLNVIIVLSTSTAAGGTQFGIVVDKVDDVADIQPEQLKPMPDIGGISSRDVVRGLASIGSRMVVLLDTDRLLAMGAQKLEFNAAA